LQGRSPTPPPQNGGFSYPPRAPAAYSHLAGTSNSPALQSGSPTTYRPSAPHPHAAYPPLRTTWSRLRAFLASTYPDLEDSLNLPAPVEVINELELRLNMPLPSSVRESYLCTDGQDMDGGLTEGLFFGLSLLPLEDVLSEWTFWRKVESDPATGGNTRLNATMGSYPQRFIKKRYASRGWLPLISDRAGNYIGVDLDPGPRGEWGQVIIWGRDFDNKCVLWRGEGEGGWGRWLDGWVTDLENGEGWELEDANGNDSAVSSRSLPTVAKRRRSR
jgi:cell wall assembly regulator SMI1